MKQIQINENKYDLYFGFKFLEQVKERFPNEMKVDGQIMLLRVNSLGTLDGYLEMADPIAVIDTLKCATVTLKQKPSNAELEQFITKLANDGEYDKFVSELRETISKEPLLNVILKKKK